MEVYTIGFKKKNAREFFGRLKQAGIRRLMGHGAGKQLEPERRDAATAPDRILDVTLSGGFRDVGGQLRERLAGRNATASRECLCGGRQHLVVTRVAAAFFDERRAGLLEQIEPFLHRRLQRRGRRVVVRDERTRQQERQ